MSLPKSDAMRRGDDHGKRPFGRRIQLHVQAAGRQSRGFLGGPEIVRALVNNPFWGFWWD